MKRKAGMPTELRRWFHLQKHAEQLRRNPTMAEAVILGINEYGGLGVRFDFNAPLLRWIIDFYDPTTGLAVEIDGPPHLKPANKRYDAYRTDTLEYFGVAMIRFQNEEVLSETSRVVASILEVRARLLKSGKKPTVPAVGSGPWLKIRSYKAARQRFP